MGRIAVDFFGIMIVCAIVFALIAQFFPDLGSPSGAVSTVISSLIAGQLYGRRTGAEVSSSFAWKVAFVLTLISLVLTGIVLWFLHMQGDPRLALELSIGAIFGIAGFLSVLSLLAIRFTFRMGVKQGANIK